MTELTHHALNLTLAPIARLSAESALTPTLRLASLLLHRLIESDFLTLYCFGDDQSTTKASLSFVVLASALVRTKSSLELAALSGFLEEFPAAVVMLMDLGGIWESEGYVTLTRSVANPEIPLEEVLDSLDIVTAAIFNLERPANYDMWLELTRGSLLAGGGLQPYYLPYSLRYSYAELLQASERKLLTVDSSPRLLAQRAALVAFGAANPDHLVTRGDDSATTYGSVGFVLLAMALAGNASPLEVAATTGFHIEFTDVIYSLMRHGDLWKSEWYLDLVSTAKSKEPWDADLKDCFECAVERFYSDAYSPNLILNLEHARGRRVLGGRVQDYVDVNFYDEFIMGV